MSSIGSSTRILSQHDVYLHRSIELGGVTLEMFSSLDRAIASCLREICVSKYASKVSVQ